MTHECSYCSRNFETKHGLSVHVGIIHKEHPLPIILPVPCTYCGELITIRGTQKDSLVMGNIDSERLPFHKGCFTSKTKGGRTFSPEHRAKISKAKTGRKLSPEHLANIAKANRRPEKRANHSKAMTGRKLTLGHCAKLSKALTGRTLSPEHRVNLSKARKGKPNPWCIGDKNPMRDPEHYDTWRKAISQRPNKEEARLASILEGFGFISHKKIEIRRSPDFVHETERRVIEYDGYGGHNPSSPRTPDTWEEIFTRDDRRDQDYRDTCYYVLSILPEDLAEGDDFVRRKVMEWMLQ